MADFISAEAGSEDNGSGGTGGGGTNIDHHDGGWSGAFDLDHLLLIPKSEPLDLDEDEDDQGNQHQVPLPLELEMDKAMGLEVIVRRLVKRVGVLEAQIADCLENQPLLHRVFQKCNALERRFKKDVANRRKATIIAKKDAKAKAKPKINQSLVPASGRSGGRQDQERPHQTGRARTGFVARNSKTKTGNLNLGDKKLQPERPEAPTDNSDLDGPLDGLDEFDEFEPEAPATETAHQFQMEINEKLEGKSAVKWLTIDDQDEDQDQDMEIPERKLKRKAESMI